MLTAVTHGSSKLLKVSLNNGGGAAEESREMLTAVTHGSSKLLRVSLDNGGGAVEESRKMLLRMLLLTKYSKCRGQRQSVYIITRILDLSIVERIRIFLFRNMNFKMQFLPVNFRKATRLITAKQSPF